MVGIVQSIQKTLTLYLSMGFFLHRYHILAFRFSFLTHEHSPPKSNEYSPALETDIEDVLLSTEGLFWTCQLVLHPRIWIFSLTLPVDVFWPRPPFNLDVVTLGHLCTVDGNGEWLQPLGATVWWFLKKLKTGFLCKPVIPLLGMCLIPRKTWDSKRHLYTHEKPGTQRDICTPMFTAVSFVIVRSGSNQVFVKSWVDAGDGVCPYRGVRFTPQRAGDPAMLRPWMNLEDCAE